MREMKEVAIKSAEVARVQMKSCCSVSLILWTILLLIFSTCLSVGTSVGLAREVGRTVIDRVVFRLMQEMGTDASDTAKTLLATAESAVASYARRLSYDDNSYQDVDFHQKMMYDLQAGYNFTFPSVFFADPSNHVYDLDASKDGSIWFQFPNVQQGARTVPEPNCTCAKVKLNGPNTRIAGSTTCGMYNYIANTRPWYVMIDSARATASKLRQTWTPFYIFEDTKPTLGITVSQAVYTRSGTYVGVVGVDLTIETLNTEITTMPATSGTRIIVIDDSETLVAASTDTGKADGVPIIYPDAQGALQRRHMRDYAVPAVQKIYSLYGDTLAGSLLLQKQEVVGKYGIGSWEYVGTSIVRTTAENLLWTVITLIPESEAAGDLDDPAKISGGCAGIVIAVVFVTSGLVVWLVYPVSRFANDMEGLAHGTLRKEDFYKTKLSVVSEVGRMQKALAQIAATGKGGYDDAGGN